MRPGSRCGATLCLLPLWVISLAELPVACWGEPFEPIRVSSASVRSVDSRILVRVGLESDLPELILPCCQEGLLADVGEELAVGGGALRVRPATEVVGGGVYRLQTVVLEDEVLAQGLARRLAALTGHAADAVYDATQASYRVRVGRFPGREGAERLMSRYRGSGALDHARVVREGGWLRDPVLLVEAGGVSRKYPGRWLALRRDDGQGIRLRRGRYRGRILLFLNDRGLLNVVNELAVEDYLRGVVPLEMGPELYDRIESLKAQTVAARTYTLRNLGGFSREGYDICASARCQVYGGMNAEHPVSDLAVAATAGEVLIHDGQMVDSLYTSSCGGFTENVEVVFPSRRAEYLRAVPCPEATERRIAGALSPGVPLESGILQTLLPSEVRRPDTEDFDRRLKEMARLASLPVAEDRLATLSRDEVRRFVASLFDMILDARLLRVQETPGGGRWSPEELRLRSHFLPSGSSGSPVLRPEAASSALRAEAVSPVLRTEEMNQVVLDLFSLLAFTREERAYFWSLNGRTLRVRSGTRPREIQLPVPLATFRMESGSLRAGDLALAPGDRLSLIYREDELIGVAQEHERSQGRLSKESAWARFRSEGSLRREVGRLYPDFRLEDLEVVSRGASGRVQALRLLGGDGESRILRGLAVRWALGVPDTLFTVRRSTRETGTGWLFEGRGHGHGVGMCQRGAYTMAVRGHTYKEILSHYYTGISLGSVRLSRLQS